MNEELLNSKLSDENIDIVLEYLKENVKDYEMSDIKYKKDENGDFVIIFEDKEIKLPHDYTVGESLYTINSALDIKEPSIPSSLSTENENNTKPKKRNPTTQDFNIAIDLDYYTELIGLLSNYQVSANSMINNSFELASLSGELLSFYNANFSESYSSKYNSLLEGTGKLYENTQMALMYYLSIDENLTKNIDTIIDSIFSDDYELTKTMYDFGENKAITYEEYLKLLESSDEYFAEQKCQYLAQFMLKIDGLITEYKFEQMPKLLDQMIETFANFKSDTEGAIDFKNRISEKYFELYGYPETTGKNSILNTIPSERWYGTSDNPTTRYDQFLLCADPTKLVHILVKDYCNGDNKKVVDLKGIIPQKMIMEYYGPDYYKDYQYHGSMLEPFEVKIKNSLFGNITGISEYIKLYEENNSLKTNFLDKIRDEKGNFDYSRISYEEITKLCNDYFGFFNTSRVKLNDLKDLCSSFDVNLVSNLNDHFLKNTYPSETVNKSIASAFCDYYNIIDEQTKKEIIESNNNPDALSNVLRKILIDDGVDGATTFLSNYYSYLNKNEFDRIMELPPCPMALPPGVSPPAEYNGKYCNTTPIPNINVTEEEIRNYLLRSDVQSLSNDFINRSYQKSNLYASLSKMIGDFRNSLNYINNSQETSYIYFAKKLDTSSVTDEMVEKAKKQLKENGIFDNDLKYIEDWQLKSYALILANDSSASSPAWKFCDGFNKKPRSIFVNQIIQGRAFDEAKAQVDVMTAGEYIWATVAGFGIGTYDGLGNFISGIGDVIWADGEVSQSEYRQQFIKQLLTTDYSLYQEYRDKNPAVLDKFSTDYSNEYIYQLNASDFTQEEVDELVNHAKTNNIPKFELEYILGIIDEDEYTKYKSLYQMKDNTEDINFFAHLQDKKWLTGYTDVVYSVGQGVGNMLIPVTLSVLSAYCPVLSYLSVGLTSLSTIGKTRESLMQQGVTDQAIIWGNALLHGLIEGAGEAIFGGVINTSWGAKAFKYIEKIPGIGKVLTFTDDIIGKIDYLSFGGKAFKEFLKRDLKEIVEELGENFWGYLVDGTMGLGWPTTDELLSESWQTIWQTALTTPILNAFLDVSNANLKKTIVLANGISVTLSLSELYSCRNENGDINTDALFTLLQRNNAIKGKFSLNTITLRMNQMFGYNIINDYVCEDGKQYLILYNGKRVNFDLSRGINLIEKVCSENPNLLVDMIYNSIDNGKSLNLNGILKVLDGETVKSMFLRVNPDKLLDLCKRIDDESLVKVFENVYSTSLSTELVELYKNRILSEIDLNLELNVAFDEIEQQSDDYQRNVIKALRKVDWNELYIPISVLDNLRNNTFNCIGVLYDLLKINIKFTNVGTDSYKQMMNSVVNILSNDSAYYALSELLDLLDLKGTDLNQQKFIRELKHFSRTATNLDDAKFMEQLFPIFLNSNGNVSYLELMKLVCQTSEAAYRKFNKYYATEYLCDYLSTNNDLEASERNAIMELIRKNGSISFTELQSFFNDGKFDYIGFLEFGLTNFRFQDSTYLIGKMDFIKKLIHDGENSIIDAFRSLADTIDIKINNLHNDDDIVAYLQSPHSEYKVLSLIANYLARDVNLRISLENEFMNTEKFLEELTYKIMETGNHQQVDINGIKITLYGSDEYIAATREELQYTIDLMPDVYLKALKDMDFKLYDYQYPGNLLFLFQYYKDDRDVTDFHTVGLYSVDKILSIFHSYNEGTIYHELGHAIDNALGTLYGHESSFFSNYTWQSDIADDDLINGRKRISNYCNTAVEEDFAEFSRVFGERFSEYCGLHPERSLSENLNAFQGESTLGEPRLIDEYPNRFKKFKKLLLIYYNYC